MNTMKPSTLKHFLSKRPRRFASVLWFFPIQLLTALWLFRLTPIPVPDMFWISELLAHPDMASGQRVIFHLLIAVISPGILMWLETLLTFRLRTPFLILQSARAFFRSKIGWKVLAAVTILFGCDVYTRISSGLWMGEFTPHIHLTIIAGVFVVGMRPSFALVLTRSSFEGRDLHALVAKSLYPRRCTALLDTSSGDILAAFMSSRLDNLRTAAAVSWQRSVEILSKASAIVIMDARDYSDFIGHEVGHVLSRGHEKKALFVVNDSSATFFPQLHNNSKTRRLVICSEGCLPNELRRFLIFHTFAPFWFDVGMIGEVGDDEIRTRINEPLRGYGIAIPSYRMLEARPGYWDTQGVEWTECVIQNVWTNAEAGMVPQSHLFMESLPRLQYDVAWGTDSGGCRCVLFLLRSPAALAAVSGRT